MTFQYTHNLVSDLPTPRKQVLLLTCMDLRLLDNTVAFMNEYNLANRYDQLAFAGASLGVMHCSSPPYEEGSKGRRSSWKDVFFHHLDVAINDLQRNIKDIFIMEHRDCGAYEQFHPTHNFAYGDDQAEQALEEMHHREQAFALADEIAEFGQRQLREAEKALKKGKDHHDPWEAERRVRAWRGLRSHCFLMDLRGEVKHLCR
ncbi:MAG: hypothetical protein JNL18_04655 [Planctomycetaceae bacterium]|nr:hypothetical protein [Planctomycetaceae bacterium]